MTTTKRNSIRDEAIAALNRIVIDQMTLDELDRAAGLLLEIDAGQANGSFTFLDAAGLPMAFSPTRSWNDYGRLVTSFEVVVSSHERYDDKIESNKVTGYWYRAHSFFGNTETEGADLRQTVARTAAKRLAHNVRYPVET